MESKNREETEQLEAQIQALFARCEVPNKGSDQRIIDILSKGLHELSIRDLVQFFTRVISTMFALIGVFNVKKVIHKEIK